MSPPMQHRTAAATATGGAPRHPSNTNRSCGRERKPREHKRKASRFAVETVLKVQSVDLSPPVPTGRRCTAPSACCESRPIQKSLGYCFIVWHIPCSHYRTRDRGAFRRKIIPRVEKMFRRWKMTRLQNTQIRKDNANRYTTGDDFCRVFSEELDSLYQLSFLAIGDHDKAERCVLAGLEDCRRANHVFWGWAPSWAKCTIIRHAIRELRPRPHRNSSSWAELDLRYSRKLSNFRGGCFKAEAVLALEDFERFVFVLSVLEQFSDHDCAVLLGCSLLEVREARTQAILHIVGHSVFVNCQPC